MDKKLLYACAIAACWHCASVRCHKGWHFTWLSKEIVRCPDVPGKEMHKKHLWDYLSHGVGAPVSQRQICQSKVKCSGKITSQLAISIRLSHLVGLPSNYGGFSIAASVWAS